MKIVALKASSQNLNQACFSHLSFNNWVGTDVKEDIKADEEKFILLPNENVEFFKLCSCSDTIIFVIASPHFYVFAVEKVKTLDLILQYLHDGYADFVFGEEVLELLIIAQDIENA